MRFLSVLVIVAALLAACGSEPPRTQVLEGDPPAAGRPMEELPTPRPRCPDGVTTADMAECMRNEAAAADRMLAALTDSLTRTAGAAVGPRLREANTWWERYRVEECAASVVRGEGGSLLAVEDFACRAELAEERIRLLRRLYAPI